MKKGYFYPLLRKKGRFVEGILENLPKIPKNKINLSTDWVFSPKTAMEERKAERRANRKTKIPPSQVARDCARTANPKQYAEFYNKHSYYRAIEYSIKKGNKVLPADQKIPHWFPYLLRNSAATAIEQENGLDEAQAALGHKTANMTRRYSKAQLRIREGLAREQMNPFADDGVAEPENN